MNNQNLENVWQRASTVLARSRLGSPPSQIVLDIKTIKIALGVSLAQSVLIAIILTSKYSATDSWFYPFYTLLQIGWIWDKITSGTIGSRVNYSSLSDSPFENGPGVSNVSNISNESNSVNSTDSVESDNSFQTKSPEIVLHHPKPTRPMGPVSFPELNQFNISESSGSGIVASKFDNPFSGSKVFSTIETGSVIGAGDSVLAGSQI